MISPMGQAALQYARRGWPVFPCRERSETIPTAGGGERTFNAKAPYTGKGLKDATRDETRIMAWWRQHPDALIGLSVGPTGCFVIDFDPREDTETGEVWTLASLKADLEAQIGVALPESLAAVTQSDGVHLWFRQPDDGGAVIRNRGNLPRHVDVRGEGGYVIAPPSVMGDTGRVYRWLRGGDWRDDASIAAAPPELIAVLRAPKQRVPTESAGAADDPTPRRMSPAHAATGIDDDVRKYGLAALDGECRAIRSAGSGMRNTQLNESALKIASLVAAGAIDAGTARAAVEAAARDNPGRDDASQLAATINSGWTAGLLNARNLDEIAAASRSRRERGPRAGPSSRAPAPGSGINGEPSSHPGGSYDDGGKKGSGGRSADDLMRECAHLPQTDLGNLERFLKRYGRDFLFVEAWGWLAWDGKRWNRDMAMALLGRAVQMTMRAIQDEAALIRDSGLPEPAMELWDASQRAAHELQQRGRMDRIVKRTRNGEITLLSDTVARWGRTSESAGHINCIAGLAQSSLAARTEDFDADPLALNVANGTLVFARSDSPGDRAATVELRPHRRRDRMTKIGAADYLPDATSPKFDAFLLEVQPDPEMRAFLDVWAGYSALGLADAQKMAVFYGQGSNGKGVWINTVAHLLGDYAWAAAIETFIDQGKYRKGSDASPDLAALAGRRMVYANEPEEGSKFSDGLIKAMTSDEPIGGVRELNKSPFQLLVTFTNTVSANHRPKIGTDHGIQRRVQIVPWDVIIPDARADPLLKAKLKAEASGILNRVVKGALAYLTNGLPMPEAIREATQAYQAENDILGQFIAICVKPMPGEKVGASALHDVFAGWQAWAQQLPASGKPWSPKYLAAQMEKKGFKRLKSSSMWWLDIALQFDRHDFIDENGRAVSRDLPAPRYSDGAAPPVPAPPNYEIEDDDGPL